MYTLSQVILYNKVTAEDTGVTEQRHWLKVKMSKGRKLESQVRLYRSPDFSKPTEC